MQSAKNEGFTLLEVLIVTTIIGILAAASTYSIGSYIRDKRSEQHVIALWSELNSFRARAIKDNCPYLVTFGTDGTYQVWQNTTGNYTTGGSTEITSGVRSASGRITLGPATNVGSNTVAGYTPASSGFTGTWETQTHPVGGGMERTIIFESNEIGSISAGALFIRNSSVPTHGYAITKGSNSHTLKLYKWDGSKWYEM